LYVSRLKQCLQKIKKQHKIRFSKTIIFLLKVEVKNTSNKFNKQLLRP